MNSGLGMGWKSNVKRSLLYDVFGEAAVEGDAFGFEVLTQDGIPASAVEAIIALVFRTSFQVDFRGGETYDDAYISDAAVADRKPLDVLAHFDNFSDSFMARDELSVMSVALLMIRGTNREFGYELPFVDVSV
jgi:hypothetical protein